MWSNCACQTLLVFRWCFFVEQWTVTRRIRGARVLFFCGWCIHSETGQSQPYSVSYTWASKRIVSLQGCFAALIVCRPSPSSGAPGSRVRSLLLFTVHLKPVDNLFCGVSRLMGQPLLERDVAVEFLKLSPNTTNETAAMALSIPAVHSSAMAQQSPLVLTHRSATNYRTYLLDPFLYPDPHQKLMGSIQGRDPSSTEVQRKLVQ